MSQAFVSTIGAFPTSATTPRRRHACPLDDTLYSHRYGQKFSTANRRLHHTFFGDASRLFPRYARRTEASIVMAISSNDFRTGTTIEMDGVPYRVLEFLHVKPGKGSAFVRTKLKNLRTGNNVDKTFRAGETVGTAQLEKATMQHTYVDGDDFVFMNLESFEEERMTADTMGEGIVKFLKLGQDVEVLKHNDSVIGVELPKTLTFEVMSTEPGAKGNSASGSVLKPATIETGAEVMVPIFINIGEQIKVSTEDGKYLGRSNE